MWNKQKLYRQKYVADCITAIGRVKGIDNQLVPALLDAALPTAKRVIHPKAPTSNFERFQQISLNLSLVSSVCVSMAYKAVFPIIMLRVRHWLIK